jgi:hypothetical protein
MLENFKTWLKNYRSFFSNPSSIREPVVVNVSEAQESIPRNRPRRAIPGLLKRFTNTGSAL